jgi:hypothetical protein
MNVFIKNFFDEILDKKLLDISRITPEAKEERYPVSAISKIEGISGKCMFPDMSESAQQVIDDFLELIGEIVNVQLLSEADTDDGEYKIDFKIDGNELSVKARVYPLAYYEMVNVIIEYFNKNTNHMLITEYFSGEEVFVVLLDKALGAFTQQSQKNINYEQLDTEVKS